MRRDGYGRLRVLTSGAIASATVAAFAPIAVGGVVDAGPPTGALAGCYGTACSSYAIVPNSPGGPLTIDPHEDVRRTNGEGAHTDFAPPAWPHEAVQGWQARVEFSGSTLGSNWRARNLSEQRTLYMRSVRG